MSNYNNFRSSIARKPTVSESVHELLNQVSEKIGRALNGDEVDREALVELQDWVDRDRADLYDAVISNTHEGNAAVSLARRDERAQGEQLVSDNGRAPAPREDLRPRE